MPDPKTKIGAAAAMFPVKPNATQFQKPRAMHPLELNEVQVKLSKERPVWADPDRAWHDDYSYYITDEGNIARKPGWNEYDQKMNANREYFDRKLGRFSEVFKKIDKDTSDRLTPPHPEMYDIEDKYKRAEISYTAPQHAWNKKAAGGTITAGTLLGMGNQKHFFTESFEKKDYGDKNEWPTKYRKELLGKGVKTEVYPLPFKHGGKVKPEVDKKALFQRWASKQQPKQSFSNGGQIVWGTRDHHIINM